MWPALIVCAGLLALFRSLDTDYWFHLAAGRSILAHGLPSREIWSLSGFGGRPALSEWLFHVALYGTYAAGGEGAVAAWRALWVMGAASLAVALVIRCGANSWVAALLLPAALLAGRARMVARPEQQFLCLVLLYLLAFETARRGGRDRTWWLLPAQVAWANVHPSWVFGPLLAGLYAAAEMWRARTQNDGARRAVRWMPLSVALVLVSAITPQPAETLSLPLSYLGRAGVNLMTRGIEELQPWSWAAQWSEPFTVLLALGAVAALFGFRRALRGAPALAVAGLLFVALGIHAQRFQAVAALVMFPALSLALLPVGPAWRKQACLGLAGLALLGSIGWAARTVRAYPAGVGPQMRVTPERAAALADSLRLPGPGFNTLEYGGYLLWVRGDSHPPLVDGRGLGSGEFQSQFVRAHFQRQAFDSLQAAWNFRYAVVKPPQAAGDRMAAWFAGDPGWAVVSFDDAASLAVRRDALPAAAVAGAYRYLTPDIARLDSLCARAATDTALRITLEAELLRARRESPELSWTSGFFLSVLELNSGQPLRALQVLDELRARFPARPGVAFRRGLALRGLNRIQEARAEFIRALQDPADHESALRALGKIP